jgi:hypothetical protein
VCSHLCGAARDIESKRVALAARALLKNARERRRIFRAFCVCIKQIAWIMQPRALLSNLIHHGSLLRSRFPCNNVNNSLCRARHGGAFVTRFSPRSPTEFFRQHPDTATYTRHRPGAGDASALPPPCLFYLKPLRLWLLAPTMQALICSIFAKANSKIPLFSAPAVTQHGQTPW